MFLNVISTVTYPLYPEITKFAQMKIREPIVIADDRLMNGLLPVVSIMSKVNSTDDTEITLDFTDTLIVPPVFVLSLIVYASRCGKQVSICGSNYYLNAIRFTTGGIKPDEIRKSEFLALMEGYSKETFIPIVSFPAQANSDDKDAILSIVEDILIRQVGIERNVATGIKYMIEETVDNVTEHSKTDRGYIFAQANPTKGYLDVCIADRGITLLGSYRTLADNEIADDMEAIKAANRGISCKNRPEAENRGFGIYTSKKMLIEGLQGQYLMISGDSLYMKNREFDNFYSLPEGIRWNGTIVAFRIPYQSSKFNYINYIE